MFNTLKYAKILQEVGFTREQSEATVVMLSEVMDEKLATKEDIFRLQVATREDFVRLEAATREDFVRLEAATREDFVRLETATKEDIQLLRRDMQLMKSELIIKMGAMQAASIAIIVALIKVL